MPGPVGTRPRVSIVVISFNMSRELPRTLYSLSAAYQLGMQASDIEILSLDNGSTGLEPDLPDIPGLRHARLANARPSPVFAINEGLARAKADLVGVWIDGARIASPGILAGALHAAELFSEPVITTPNYQLGAEHHAAQKTVAYSQDKEDELLQTIRWPEKGYRLFEIAKPEMRSPTGPMLESNGIFLRKSMWEQLGGYEEAFDEPGGGYANPDLLRRAVDLPHATLVRLTDEGTFHQCHGGVSTSTETGLISALKEAGTKYRRLRGRPAGLIRQAGVNLLKQDYLPELS